MNKLSLILIIVFALIVSACANNALAKAEAIPAADNSTERALYDRSQEPIIVGALKNADGQTNTGWSGDDLYDPAAGALLDGIHKDPVKLSSGSYSGDDLYDPAAGALLEGIQKGLNKFTGGGYSGDDDYDPAAGGLGK